jgi:GPI mannosyltransferase 3
MDGRLSETVGRGEPLGEAASERERGVVVALLFVALFLRVLIALRLPSIGNPDEIFQTLEPAHRLAFGPGVITWEWRDGVRSWVFPAFLASIMRATAWAGLGSSGYVAGITLVLSLLSLTTVWFAWAWGRRVRGTNAGLIGAGAAAIWWQLILYAPRALNEVVAAHVLLIGLYLGVYGDRLSETKRFVLAGLCCGLAVSLRVQFAPAVAFSCLWFCHPHWRKRTPALALGLLTPIVAFGLVDAFTWSYPFQSFVRYVWVNVVQGKSLQYGTEPWYWYGWILLQYLGPVIPLAIVGARRSPFLAWVALVIVGSHSVLAHKEIRFVYAAVPIVLTLGALGLAELAELLHARWRRREGARGAVTAGVAVFGVVSLSYAWGFPGWSSATGGVAALDSLSADPTVCGVGLYGAPWFATGGYAHLHQNIPIVIVPDSGLGRDAPAFNALIAPRTVRIDPHTGYWSVDSWRDVTLYRRDGSCADPGADEVNAVLRRHGW